MVNQKKPLTVYKASAGSGKTFTLAVEYMKLVIADPSCYRNTLAVTFTNKATEEMKMRILSQLYGLWKQLPDSAGYMARITEDLGISPEQAAVQAGTALNLLLHNYNYFRVETIDTFFQSVLRNLARELDLTANLRIGLNDYQVEQQAVDELIDSLRMQDRIFIWIMQYVRENISEDKGWNVIGLIKRFGENIFKDFYKQHNRALTAVLHEQDFFDHFTREMNTIKQESLNVLNHYIEFFFDTLEENNLDIADFSNGTRGVCGYFLKLRNGKYDDKDVLTATVKAAMDDPGKWVKKKEQVPGNPIYNLVNDILLQHLNETERQRVQQMRLYKSADLTLRHMNQLRLLGSIEEKVRILNAEANRFLLSDTQTLLHALIQDSDSPFIFEKIGTQLRHVMIDEFQDTSTVQWKNFKVLLQECMSHEDGGNLIVGDVKQSIYRWRSGDWRLLNGIENEFPRPEMQLDIRSLCTNYRSEKNIVTFNNEFFHLAAAQEYQSLATQDAEQAQALLRAYEDVRQEAKRQEDSGLVHIELMPAEDYQAQMMERITETIDMLTAQGATARQIAILVRSNTTIQDIASHFMTHRPDINLVSDEAFRLDASQAVNTLVSGLRHLAHPDNQLDKALLKALHIDSGLMEERNRLLTMPLYDLAEHLYSRFHLNGHHEQNAYVLAFFDQLGKYLTDHTPSIDGFLEEWDATLHEKTIQSSEVDGIRLITIHKSKGLEFDHVIIPSCDWRLEIAGSTIWCTPTETPFNELPLVPVDFSERRMMGTIYEKDYLYEHLQNRVDNMNLLYVAFTRAAKSLFVFGRRGEANLRSQLIETVIDPLCQALGATYSGDVSDRKDTIVMEYGKLTTHHTDRSHGSDNVFLRPVTAYRMETIESFDNKTNFKQSNKSKDFVEGDENEETQKRYVKTGSILHRVFSTIRTVDDVDQALRQLEFDGVLYDDDLRKEDLCAMLRKRLEHPKVRAWFSASWTLFNECTILHVDPLTGQVVEHRPDRVMTDGDQYVVVDFKFGRPSAAYRQQVLAYMQLIKDMGHPHVKGYLWYVYSNQIEEVI